MNNQKETGIGPNTNFYVWLCVKNYTLHIQIKIRPFSWRDYSNKEELNFVFKKVGRRNRNSDHEWNNFFCTTTVFLIDLKIISGKQTPFKDRTSRASLILVMVNRLIVGDHHRVWWSEGPWAWWSPNKATSGQSYIQFMLVNYDSRAVIWCNFKSGMTLES